ncbi:very short patch repair endonuclease [Domibacillus sp. DTU_2020_1001157_1_SI_ALB_TIR_016]|uniref:very short patch repair endonuclease n=1 Tax=Domibacillus sp. DTU_2020_1001157_1_SI_ALB_TIR_016 TaxID=3077789 RepID=UPI0028EACF5D|nr:very short patch repair endonuclease [Domibacillus sp. DTU_2020_1001157_1_SI_ALB_TIR_016]WNS82195.1 very short patch repair endonuclease [Domibacillus sp. DTU_2020_1001157_1_SI_ALB_TIR_016]
MTDNISKSERSEVMKKVRSISKMEEEVRKALWKKGIRFRKNVKKLVGKPDIAISKYKIVIFIDSCFWHACPLHGRRPKSNTDFWNKKLDRNKQRDQEVNLHYLERGWHVRRVWEHELKADFDGVIDDLAAFITSQKNLQASRL